MEEIERLACHEELGVVLDELRSILFDFEVLPGISRVLNSLTFFHVVVTTSVDAFGTTLSSSVALCALSFAFIMSFSFYFAFTNREVSLDLSFSWNRAINPWVSLDLLHGGSLGRVECHHLLKEVLELRRVDISSVFSLSVSLPEDLCASCSN